MISNFELEDFAKKDDLNAMQIAFQEMMVGMQ